MELGARLRSHGVDVLLDLWELKLGQDIYAYIEEISRGKHVDKVLVICDAEYTKKANEKRGGVGKEATIISEEIYNRSAQGRIIPIVVQKDSDGMPYLPQFLRNRFYVDMSTQALFASNYEILLRGIYDEPSVRKPPLGSLPDGILQADHRTSPPARRSFAQPAIVTVVVGFEPAGYSKQTAIVRDSQGKLTAFVRDKQRRLAFVQSDNPYELWSPPSIFDETDNPDSIPHVAAAVDSADQVHVIWGPVPEAGDAIYGLLRNDTSIKKEVIGTGAFARNIAVDSADRPHVVWTNLRLVSYDLQRVSVARSEECRSWSLASRYPRRSQRRHPPVRQ